MIKQMRQKFMKKKIMDQVQFLRKPQNFCWQIYKNCNILLEQQSKYQMNILKKHKVIELAKQLLSGLPSSKFIISVFKYNNPHRPIYTIIEIIEIEAMRKILSRFDLFPSLPTLRAHGESEVVNLCGSLFSVAIFGCFVYLFLINLQSTINFGTIQYKQTQSMRPSDQPISNITIAVGIFNASLTKLLSIFELKAFASDRHMNMVPLDVFPCTRQMWSAFDDVKYKTLNLEHDLCIQREGVEIYGQFGTPDVSFIMFNLSICNNKTSSTPCAPQVVINQFFATKMMWGRFLPFSFIIMDTSISASKENALTFNPYQKTQFLLFNLEQSTFIQTFLGTYEINTDMSYLPYSQISQQKGHFVKQCVTTNIVNYLDLPVFIESYIFPSPYHKVINRNYGKFDSILSYVGGLYGIVISFLSFLLLSFNQYKYQLRVSAGAFSFRQAYLAREEDFTFLKYMKFVVYLWIKNLLCVQLNWRDCQAIEEARQEAIEQIDVKHLLKRISHLEKVIKTFVNPSGETVMYMTESNTLQQAKRRRSLVSYCAKFSAEDKSPTISNFQIIQTIISFSTRNIGLSESSFQNQKEDLNSGNFQLHFQEHKKSKYLPESLSLMQSYVKKYIKRYWISDESFDLDQNDLKAEEELAVAFYKLDEDTRMEIIKEIPLGILYRLSKYDSDGKEKIKVEELVKESTLPVPRVSLSKSFKIQKKGQNKLEVSKIAKTKVFDNQLY